MTRKPAKGNNHVIIYEGERISILSLCLADGSCPARDFLDNELSGTERATMATAFKMLGDHGFISNKERFKKVEGTDEVLEFKDFQVRIFCCWAGKGRMFLLFGVRKKKDRHKPADVKRAEELAAYAQKQ